MSKKLNNRIPLSPSLGILHNWAIWGGSEKLAKKRIMLVSLISIAVAIAISFIAKLLVSLIDFVTNISFFGRFDFDFRSPAVNNLGLWVIIIPVIGGLIVGLMALYGSKAIRGHGIPEAMEQVLTNKSRIKPAIAILKPVSSAIAIGTGGPFGAEGPIIATGGALGSTLGQILKISANERKIILAAGATAGMSAIFGTPIAAIFLAIELLLFEFSPRAIIPVALACITGAAGHHLLFESGPVFPMAALNVPSNSALLIYSIIGIVIGFVSIGITKLVYLIEDAFEKLPISWVWWPALGGLAVGLIGYVAPHTLGVGYDNIIMLLSGKASLIFVLTLCFFKFLSWSIALGSGTSGGTLAPLMTIGGAVGALLGYLLQQLFPGTDISIPMAGLVGMSAMFAGASRAYLTSILFALEATHQVNGLLALLAGCTASYIISFFFMKNTIMTEKIARRGVNTPDSYRPDVLGKTKVADIVTPGGKWIDSRKTIKEAREFVAKQKPMDMLFAMCDEEGDYLGAIKRADLSDINLDPGSLASEILVSNGTTIKGNENLRNAMELMHSHNMEFLPVVLSDTSTSFQGFLTLKDILSVFSRERNEDGDKGIYLSLGVQRKRMIIKGRQMAQRNKSKPV